jgi:acetolactate decarboxylase
MCPMIRRVIIAGLAIVLGISGGCASLSKERSAIFQYSAINALLEGVYDSGMTVGELLRHGDLGIGTFEGLDGEMIALDGIFYQIRADGKAYRIQGSMKTPFAVVTIFNGVSVVAPESSPDFQGFTNYLDELIPTKNIFYAIRVDGMFKQVKTRSVYKQQKPYPRLVDALANQPEFELRNIRGTLVGFRCPAYVGGVNVPGYHLHFITEDKMSGGHVLGFQTDSVNIRVDAVHEFRMVLPRSESFYTTDLTREKKGDLDKVEKSRAPTGR